MHDAVRKPGQATQRARVIEITDQRTGAQGAQGCAILGLAGQRQPARATAKRALVAHEALPHISTTDHQDPFTPEPRWQGNTRRAGSPQTPSRWGPYECGQNRGFVFGCSGLGCGTHRIRITTV
jgi:hypothetical protein